MFRRCPAAVLTIDVSLCGHEFLAGGICHTVVVFCCCSRRSSLLPFENWSKDESKLNWQDHWPLPQCALHGNPQPSFLHAIHSLSMWFPSVRNQSMALQFVSPVSNVFHIPKTKVWNNTRQLTWSVIWSWLQWVLASEQCLQLLQNIWVDSLQNWMPVKSKFVECEEKERDTESKMLAQLFCGKEHQQSPCVATLENTNVAHVLGILTKCSASFTVISISGST